MGDNQTFKQRWRALPPKTRMLTAFGGGFTLLFIVALLLSPSTPQPVPGAKMKPATPVNLSLPGSDGHDMTMEKLSASLEAVKGVNKKLLENQEQINKSFAAQRLEGQAQMLQDSPQTVEELKRLRRELDDVKAKQSQAPSLDDALPGIDGPQVSVVETAPEVEEPKLRIMVGDAREQEQEEEAPTKKPLVFLPAGSNFEGVLLNGMDAPTSGVAQKNPVPALVRLKTDAILPNRYRYDVRECFAIVSGFGDLSSERVQLQTVVMSCVKNDGAVIETKIEGYVVGEDGLVGVRGKPVSKQGQMIAKSFVSGFASGISSAMAPTPVQALNTTPGSTTQYQTPNMGNVLASGTAQGLSQSARSISQFYLDMAKQMVPVIEIGANRRVTIILLKGIEMNMTGEKQQ